MSRILSTGGVYTPFPGRHSPWADTPPDRHPQADTPKADIQWADTPWADACWADTPLTPQADHPADGYCSGRYASYWNAFLFEKKINSPDFSTAAELKFSETVYPTKIDIYETYNPGSVVRILAADCDPDDLCTGNVRFVRMKIIK